MYYQSEIIYQTIYNIYVYYLYSMSSTCDVPSQMSIYSLSHQVIWLNLAIYVLVAKPCKWSISFFKLSDQYKLQVSNYIFQVLQSNIDEEIKSSLLINNQIHSHNTIKDQQPNEYFTCE